MLNQQNQNLSHDQLAAFSRNFFLGFGVMHFYTFWYETFAFIERAEGNIGCQESIMSAPIAQCKTLLCMSDSICRFCLLQLSVRAWKSGMQPDNDLYLCFFQCKWTLIIIWIRLMAFWWWWVLSSSVHALVLYEHWQQKAFHENNLHQILYRAM